MDQSQLWSYPSFFFLYVEILQPCTFHKEKKKHKRAHWIFPSYSWLPFHRDGMCCTKRTIHLWTPWQSLLYMVCVRVASKTPGWVGRMPRLQWSAASTVFPCCLHLYQQHSRCTDDSGIVIACHPSPFWLLSGHSDIQNWTDKPAALMLQCYVMEYYVWVKEKTEGQNYVILIYLLFTWKRKQQMKIYSIFLSLTCGQQTPKHPED